MNAISLVARLRWSARVAVFLLAIVAVVAVPGNAQVAPGSPRLVKEIVPGPGGGAYGDLAALDGSLIFGAANEGGVDWALWRSDGTTAGTVVLKGPLVGAGDFELFKGDLYFSGHDEANGAELWRTDGTPAGTELVADLVVGAGSSGPRSLTVVGDTLYFDGTDAASGRVLYKSDGTALGTSLVEEFAPPERNFPARLMTAAGGLVYFVAGSGSPEGRELWRSDGTPAGTGMVTDIHPGVFSAHPEFLTELNGSLLFSASSPAGEQLWRSDGTAAGTQPVDPAGPEGAESIVAHNGEVFFGAGGPDGRELWRSDGTAAGTRLVADVNPGPDDSRPLWITSVGTHVFFSAVRADVGRELFRSNGLTTELVKDINPGPDSSEAAPVFEGNSEGPFRLPASADEAFFIANDGSAGYELWRSDGTPGGTERAGDINPGPAGSFPERMTVAGSQVFFRAHEPETGRELWALGDPESDELPPPAAGDVVAHIVQGSVLTPPFPAAPITFGLSGLLGEATVPLELLDLSLASACSRLQPGDPCRELALAQSVRCRLQPGDPCREAQVGTTCARFQPGDPCLDGNQAVDLFVELRRHPEASAAPVLQPATLASATATGFDVVYDAHVPGVAATQQTLRFAIGAGQPLRFANVQVGAPQSPRFHVTFELERTGGAAVAGPLWTVAPSGTVVPPPPDTTPPQVTVPAGVVADATSPAGATVGYAVSATDDEDAEPAIACAPASGSVLPVGTTTVGCTATDDAGNAATATFAVRVRGAAEQMVALVDKTLRFVDQPALETTLRQQLEAAAAALVARKKSTACAALNLYIAVVRLAPAHLLTAAEKSELTADATRIRTAIGC